MHILSLGLNHTTAPVSLRERLALKEDRLQASLSGYFNGHSAPALAEIVVLSTCNRVEIYAVAEELAYPELEAFLSAASGESLDELHPCLYRFQDLDAARHIFHVAAGLDSPVIGEPQILGQITRALEVSRGRKAAGPILNRLFQAAIRAGKRARTETGISRHPVSIASLAASLAEKTFGEIETASVVVLGAGEMAELTVEALRKRGVQNIRVVNRTLEHARTIADRWGAEPATFESLDEVLRAADILISSTSAPHFVVSASTIAAVMGARAERPLLLIDIAVPRDIEPQAGNIPRVQLMDIDALNTRLQDSFMRRVEEAPKVKQILEEELLEFEQYWKSLEMLTVISNIYQQAEAIRTAELQKSLRRLPELTDVERERIELLTQSLVRKLLALPTRRLRKEASSERAPEYAAMARLLFDASGEPLHSLSILVDT